MKAVFLDLQVLAKHVASLQLHTKRIALGKRGNEYHGDNISVLLSGG